MEKEMFLENLKSLKENMEELEWIITPCTFQFKGIDYIILVKLLDKKEDKVRRYGVVKKDPYALVQLQFLKASNLSDCLIVEANRLRLLGDENEIKRYFNMGSSNGIDLSIVGLTKLIGKVIPLKVSSEFSVLEKDAVIISLSRSDSEDPNKRYCTGVKRNPPTKKRSIFNDNKARILVPNLYEYFNEDSSISFCFSANKKDEKSNREILEQFSYR